MPLWVPGRRKGHDGALPAQLVLPLHPLLAALVWPRAAPTAPCSYCMEVPDPSQCPCPAKGTWRQPWGNCASLQAVAEATKLMWHSTTPAVNAPSQGAARGTWEMGSRGQSGARAGGFPGFKIHTKGRAGAAAAPQHPHSPNRARAAPARHPSGQHQCDKRCPCPWGDLCGAALLRSCLPASCWANRNLAPRQGTGQAQHHQNQVLSLATRMQAPTRAGAVQDPALWCPSLLGALRQARAVLTILDTAPRDCHIPAPSARRITLL